MPYVVFIAAPELETLCAMHKAVVDAGIATKLLTDSDLKKTVDESARIQRAYNHYFDLIIVNDNLDKAFEKLQTAIENLSGPTPGGGAPWHLRNVLSDSVESSDDEFFDAREEVAEGKNAILIGMSQWNSNDLVEQMETMGKLEEHQDGEQEGEREEEERKREPAVFPAPSESHSPGDS
ncbi:MAGUK p55 subfamily member 6 [Myotis brandtii]|uniref:MAGUK p55 subfamily member 6 n=1 Tax=Myotis brandtii TaxID=109478 RepID=S7MI89_MYOBR|nr:MAGUK p55 subfamily member 6 [Myotis brandtii]